MSYNIVAYHNLSWKTSIYARCNMLFVSPTYVITQRNYAHIFIYESLKTNFIFDSTLSQDSSDAEGCINGCNGILIIYDNY